MEYFAADPDRDAGATRIAVVAAAAAANLAPDQEEIVFVQSAASKKHMRSGHAAWI